MTTDLERAIAARTDEHPKSREVNGIIGWMQSLSSDDRIALLHRLNGETCAYCGAMPASGICEEHDYIEMPLTKFEAIKVAERRAGAESMRAAAAARCFGRQESLRRTIEAIPLDPPHELWPLLSEPDAGEASR